MRQRLRAIFLSPSALPGWVLILWKVIDFSDTMVTAMEWVNHLWAFVNSTLGDWIILIIGFSWLGWLVIRPNIHIPWLNNILAKNNAKEITVEDVKAEIEPVKQSIDQSITRLHHQGSQVSADIGKLYNALSLTRGAEPYGGNLETELRFTSFDPIIDIDSPEPHIELICEITSSADRDVEIIGIDGQLKVDDTVCAHPARCGRQVIAARDQGSIRVYQPISFRTADRLTKNRIHDEQARLWIGTCAVLIRAIPRTSMEPIRKILGARELTVSLS